MDSGLIVILLIVAVFGLIHLFFPDLVWVFRKFSNESRGIKDSEPTDAFYFMTRFQGAFMLVFVIIVFTIMSGI